MNWTDYMVIAMIIGFGISGMVTGFILSIFKLASFFVSVIVAVKFYPMFAGILMKTALYTNIKASILRNLMQQQGPKIDAQAKQAAADSVMSGLQLPGFLKDTLVSHIPNPSSILPIDAIMDTISGELAKLVIDVMSLVILYILIRVALIFVRFILQGIAKLPLFKQVDKLGGFAFGAVEGLLTVYIVFAVVMIFNTSSQFKSMYDAINASMIARYFYQNNFIITWMFPK